MVNKNGINGDISNYWKIKTAINYDTTLQKITIIKSHNWWQIMIEKKR